MRGARGCGTPGLPGCTGSLEAKSAARRRPAESGSAAAAKRPRSQASRQRDEVRAAIDARPCPCSDCRPHGLLQRKRSLQKHVQDDIALQVSLREAQCPNVPIPADCSDDDGEPQPYEGDEDDAYDAAGETGFQDFLPKVNLPERLLLYALTRNP